MELYYKAFLCNDLNVLKHVIECLPGDINDISFNGKTVLNAAVMRNAVDVVKFLVQHGARLNNRKSGISPLFIAIRAEYWEMVNTLIELGANIHSGWVLNEIVPTLQYAINYLNVEIIQLLLKKGANANCRHITTHETPLHIVVNYVCTKYAGKELTNLQVKVSKILIKNGADVRSKDIHGRTPLDYAICAEHTELCKLFLREGAEIIGSGKIWEDGIPQNRFEYIACVQAFKCPELVRLCLERGGDYNYRDRHGLTPYHCGLAKHNPDMVKVYWEFGCPFDQPELQPGKMKEMLWYNPSKEDKYILGVQKNFIDGIKLNRLELVMTALKNGAVPKGCSVNIPSTLHLIAAKGSCEIARVLLDRGVPVNRVNSSCETPLFVAAKRQDLELCKVFLQFGACFKMGDGSLIKATVEGNEQLCKLFKEVHKAFQFVKKGNLKLVTKLQSYMTSGNLEMSMVLMNCINKRGLTLMGEALRLGNVEMANELMNIRLKYL